MRSRILIVEDDVIVANNLQDRLGGLGYDVCGVLPSGIEAIEKVPELEPDLVLMDIRLKGDQDGIVTAQKLRRQFDLPVVYLTGYADEATLQRAKLSEPYGYILKPFEIRELHSTVEMALYKHAMEQRLRDSEQRYRTLVEHSLQGIMIVQGAPARIAFANAQVSLSTGYSVEALLEMAPADAASLVHAEDRQVILGYLEDHLAGRPAPASGTFRFVRRDGRLRWVQYFVSTVEGSGEPALQVAFVDITARKRAEGALQQAHDDLEKRVEERTSELVEVNERLRSEVAVRRAAEQAFQQRNRELEMLHRVSQDLSSSLNLRRVLTNALDEARHLLNAVGSTVWLVDPERDELACWQATGRHSEVLHGWQLPISEGFVGLVIRTGQSVIVPDAREDDRHFKGVDQATGEEIRSLLCVPLKVADRLLGVLQVVDPEPNRFETTDLALLEPLAASTAIAIENARLYSEADRLRRFNEGMVQSMQEGILVEGKDGRFTYANPAASDKLGYSMDELFALQWEQICADDSEPEAGEAGIRRAARQNDRNETVLRTKAGQQIPVQVSRQPLMLGDRSTGTLSVFMDITARKESEAALLESEERFRNLFENAPLCIFELDLAHKPSTIVNCNRQAEKVYGWSRTEFASIGMEKLFAHGDMPDPEQIENAISPGNAATLESVHMRRDGSRFPVRISAAPSSGPGGSRVILAVEDMTVEQGRRSEEQAIVEERRRIAREIHDGLAQNLASLRLQARLWHNIIDEDPGRMHDEVESMRELLREQIRDVRRSIFALRPIALDELGFNRALQQFVQDFGEQNQLHIDLQMRGAQEHLPALLEPVLFRIIQEALNNVRKYADARSVWIELGLEEADSLALVVQDDGRGFDLAILDEAPRFGHLGLRQMRERVEELDGSLFIESRPGHGTRIRVLLPTFEIRGGL
jgi:PAS domain S-box-containing protein